MADYILVIDEGTTSTRAIAFDRDFNAQASAQTEIGLSFPQDGWVEQDGLEIWSKTLSVCRQVIDQVGGPRNIAAIGITNQRETTLIWDRKTGVPIAPAIVWQDRRTADDCARMREAGHEDTVVEETGLLLDPYFSSTKIAWLLSKVEGARARAEAGDLAFGTVDSWLIWKLTAGDTHVTDVTNASRTQLYRLGLGDDAGWSEDMLAGFGVPETIVARSVQSAAPMGKTAAPIFGYSIPITSAIGDQQAALVGQGCFAPGEGKITLGTGAFLVVNTGRERVRSKHRLLSTVGYEAPGGAGALALEGSIFQAGTVVKWLRDELGLLSKAADSEAMATSVEDSGGLVFVPAFTGLGAPYWNSTARGAITGISRGTRAAHIVRAGLESVAYQALDLLDAFKADGAPVSTLRVDGGMAANNWLMQFMADICDTPVERPDYAEMTALGAAVLAGVQIGWLTLDDWAGRDAPGRRFEPNISAEARNQVLDRWRTAIDRVQS